MRGEGIKAHGPNAKCTQNVIKENLKENLLGRPRRRWKKDIKINLQDIFLGVNVQNMKQT
jgi:hypothetical protein